MLEGYWNMLCYITLIVDSCKMSVTCFDLTQNWIMHSLALIYYTFCWYVPSFLTLKLGVYSRQNLFVSSFG